MIQTLATESRENADPTRTRVQGKSAIVGTGAALRRYPAPGLSALGNQATLLRLSRTRPQLQCKLEIGAANDPLEAEADRIAEQVMRMPDHGSVLEEAPQTLHRKCANCEEEEKTLHMKNDGGPASSGEVPPIVHQALNMPGQPLDAESRALFEPRFGRDFGQVLVNTTSVGAESARALGAHAYTVGTKIVFGEGKLSPTSNSGRRLLAHELAHVVQQTEISALTTTERIPIQRDDDPGASVAPGPASAPGLASQDTPISSKVKDFSHLKPGIEIDVADGRAFALEAIDAMSPFGAKISSPPSDAIAISGPAASAPVAANEPSPEVGTIQTSSIATHLQRSGGGTVKPEAGFVGSIQLCYDACNSELSVVGWIWAGGGVVTRGLFGGAAWWGAYVFAEKEFLRSKLNFMPTLNCGVCRSDCKPAEGDADWGGGVSGFPIVLKPGERASLKQAGIEVGVLLTPHVTRCDADLEVIALIDLTKYLGPIGAAVVAGEELANKLGKKFGIEIECGVGIDVSGTVHLCKSIPGGGILGITSDSAKICGGGYAGCGIGLEHDKSALPGI